MTVKVSICVRFRFMVMSSMIEGDQVVLGFMAQVGLGLGLKIKCRVRIQL